MPNKATKWQQIFDALEARIQSGQLAGKLPSYPKLAEEHETSVITISRVIRELERRGYVSVKPKSGVRVEPTRITLAASPTPASRELVKRIALILPVTLSDPYWARVADGALSACGTRNRQGRTRWRLELNYSTPHLPHHDFYSGVSEGTAEDLTPAEKEAAHQQEMKLILDLSEEVEALMVAPRLVFHPDFYSSLFRRGTRIITLDNKVQGVPCVASHNRRAAYKGITFLLLGLDSNQGRLLRRVASATAQTLPAHLMAQSPHIYVIAESPQVNTMRERITGCQQALHDAAARGYQLPAHWLRVLDPVKNLSDYRLEAYTATLKLIESLESLGQLHRPQSGTRPPAAPHAPIALFALTDRCALGCYQALHEKGYTRWTAPAQSVALLSYDNLWQSLQAHSISSLAQDPFHMGRRAAELLFDMPHPSTFFPPGTPPPDELLEVGLVQRNSTHPLTPLQQ